MNILLQRPIAFLDLETTGVNLVIDRIVEIGVVKVMPDGTEVRKRRLLNPQMPIPPEASAVHGITDGMVADAPTFRQVANEVRQFLDDCDLAGYNSNRFDWPMLVEEFLRAGLEFEMSGRRMLDVQRIFHSMEPRTLSAALRFYCGEELVSAHSAEADAEASWKVFNAQLARYPALGNTLDSVLKQVGEEVIVDMARRFVWEKGIEVFNFGKYKGRPVAEVLKTEPQYYDWMMRGDFPMHTKRKLSEIFNRTLLRTS